MSIDRFEKSKVKIYIYINGNLKIMVQFNWLKITTNTSVLKAEAIKGVLSRVTHRSLCF